jgi:HK97 family phage portal protein
MAKEQPVWGIINGRFQEIPQGKAIMSLAGGGDPALRSGSQLARPGDAWMLSATTNRCIQIRANALSKIPWEITDEDDVAVEGSVAEAIFNESRLDELLRLGEMDSLIWGHALWLEGKPEGSDQILAYRRQNAGTVTVEADLSGVGHIFISLRGKREEVMAEDCFFVHEFDPYNDLDGVPLVKVVERAISIEHNADRYLAAFFANFALPPVIFETPDTVQEAEMQKTIRWWNRLFRGADNQHKVGFIDKGFKANQIGFEPGKLALKEIRDAAQAEITKAFGIPPVLLGVEAANYATADEQRQSLYEEQIVPRSGWWQGHINGQIMSKIDPGHRFRFKIEELETLQEDENRHAERVVAVQQAGIINTQAAAEELGYGPEEMGEGRQAPPSPFGNPLQPGNEPQDKEPPKAEVVEEKARTLDLRKWHAKAMKRIKAGRPAAAAFTSPEIPPTMVAAIMGQLEAAETAEDVDRVFDEAEKWNGYPA